MIENAGGLAAIILRFLVLSATTLAVGGWVFARFVAPGARGASVDARRGVLNQLSCHLAMIGAAAVAMLAVPRLVVQAHALADATEPVGPMVLSLLRTHWGMAVIGQAAVAAMLFLTLRRATTAAWQTRVADLAALALVVAPSMQGHAVADPERALWSIVVDTLHVAAAGGWIGALAVLTIIARLHRSQSDASALTAELVIGFHPVALVCAGTVFATGLATAWLRMGAPEGIANPTYSGLFVLKVLLVGVTGALGAGHAKLAKRRVAQVDAVAVNRTLLGETLLALIVLVVTGLLVGTDPLG